jgi:hypothetical protein
MIGAIHVHVSLEKKVCSSANLKETNVLYGLVSF